MAACRAEGMNYSLTLIQPDNPNFRFANEIARKVSRRVVVRSLAVCGYSPEFIANMVGIEIGILCRDFADDLEINPEKANAMVELSMFDQAISGRSFQATAFWLERRVRDVWGPPEEKATAQEGGGVNVLFATRHVSEAEWIEKLAQDTNRSPEDILGSITTPDPAAGARTHISEPAERHGQPENQ